MLKRHTQRKRLPLFWFIILKRGGLIDWSNITIKVKQCEYEKNATKEICLHSLIQGTTMCGLNSGYVLIDTKNNI